MIIIFVFVFVFVFVSHLEAALSVGGLGGVDLLGLIGGDVQVSNNLADVVSEAP